MALSSDDPNKQRTAIRSTAVTQQVNRPTVVGDQHVGVSVIAPITASTASEPSARGNARKLYVCAAMRTPAMRESTPAAASATRQAERRNGQYSKFAVSDHPCWTALTIVYRPKSMRAAFSARPLL